MYNILTIVIAAISIGLCTVLPDETDNYVFWLIGGMTGLSLWVLSKLLEDN